MSLLRIHTSSLRPLFAWALIAVLVSAFVASLLSLQAGIFALLFVIVAWWVWENHTPALLFLIVIVPLLPMFKLTQSIGTITLLKDVIIGTLFLRLFFVPFLQKKLPYRRNALIGPIVALLVWTLVELIRADAVTLGILRAREIVLYVVLYFAVLYVPNIRALLRPAATTLFASAAIVALLGVYQLFFALDSAVLRYDPARAIWIPRVSSTLAHPSIYGQYLITVTIGFVALALVAAKKRDQLFGIGGSILSIILIYLTYSRAVWIGFATAVSAMVVAWFWLKLVQEKHRRFYWRALVPLGLGMIVTVVVVWRFTSAGVFLQSAIDPTYASNSERLVFLSRLVSPLTIRDTFVGLGLGDVTSQNFRAADVGAFDIAIGASRTIQLAKNSTLVDNQYVKTLIELGMLGLGLYGWLYVMFGRTCLVVFRQRTPETRVVGLWGLGFLVAFVVQAFFIDIWDIFPTNAAFWIMAAIVSVMSWPSTSVSKSAPHSAPLLDQPKLPVPK